MSACVSVYAILSIELHTRRLICYNLLSGYVAGCLY